MARPENGRDPAVRVVDLAKEFPGGVRALGGVTFDVPRGELTSIIGPSGCGKTTTLKIVAGLLEATSGRVEVGGTPVTEPGPDRAFVFQDFALMPWATVLRNPGLRTGAARRAPQGARADGARVRRQGGAEAASRTPTRTSSPAGCANALGSPGRSRWTPTSC